MTARWLRLLPLIFALPACSADPCAGISGACVTAHVQGSANIDQLKIQLGGSLNRSQVAPATPRHISLPVDVRIVLPTNISGALDITIAGELSGQAVASSGVQHVTIPAGGHAQQTFTLSALGIGTTDLSAASNDMADGQAPSPDMVVGPDMTLTCVPTSTCPASIGCGMIPVCNGGMVNCGPCQLTSIEPQIANAGSTVVLEGTFSNTATVTFPGGVTRAANVLGSHRASVTVPATATAGDLVVNTGGGMVGPVFFRRPSFALGLQNFYNHYPQTTAAQTMSTLATYTYGAAVAVKGNTVYLVGGFTVSASNRVQTAIINADGTIGTFSYSPSVMTFSRTNPVALVIGNYLYVFGGNNATSFYQSIDRATINADGTLGAFATLTNGVQMQVPRAGATGHVIGNQVYIVGGQTANGGSPTASVEVATIQPDNTLTNFSLIAGVNLVAARTRHSGFVTGGSLYVLGGYTADPTSVERAVINADGSLQPFQTVNGINLATGRNSFSTVILGSNVYVVGGSDAAGNVVSTTERSPISNDALTGFTTATTSANILPRGAASVAVVGNYLYVFGGTSNLATVGLTLERASINSESALGTISPSAATLQAARTGYCLFTIGNHVYVAGGNVNTVESATVAPDGTLSGFTTAAGIAAPTGNGLYTGCAITPGFVYVIGGSGSAPAQIDSAPINADATIGNFSTVAAVLPAGGLTNSNCFITGSNLYCVGQLVGSGNIEVTLAAVNSDGSIGSFSNVTTTSWRGGSAFVSRSNVYDFGAMIPGQSATSYGAAPINSDQTVGTFAAVASTNFLKRGLASLDALFIGNSFFVFGGNGGGGTGFVAEVEQATVSADGSIGPFAILNGISLSAPRQYMKSAEYGNFVYVIGGDNAGTALPSIDQASLP